MNVEKIGDFIKKLREEKNWTQEELARLIPISRQAISKWERGLAIPDSLVLIKLSEIFNISINEILSGEKITKSNEKEINNLSLKLYDVAKKKSKLIKILTISFIVLIALFLLIYFVNSYRKIKVYTITGVSDNIYVNDGIFVQTNEKLFFNIGDILVLDTTDIQSLNLYYVDQNNDKNSIVFTTQDTLMLIDYCGYDEYFDTSNLEYIINNLFLEVEYNDSKQIIKLNFNEDYINDNIFSFNEEKISSEKNNSKKTNINLQDETLIKNIKSKYKNTEDGYIYELKTKNIVKNYFYDDNLNCLRVTLMQDEKIMERWVYQFNVGILEYQNYDLNESFIYENNETICLSEKCSKSDKKIREFYQEILESIEERN